MSVLNKIFKSYSEKEVKRVKPIVNKINGLEEEMTKLTDNELRAKTEYFKGQLKEGKTLDDILPEAFAVVREASKRVLGMRHFDVQLIGGIILHQGRIAEMKTGEGKTLVATLPVYLNALEGKGVHVITVNDYLAKRDSEWMGKLYKFLGLSVGLVIAGMEPKEKQEAYNADITYGTNNEFGFDYLRDNMVIYKDQLVQRGLHYAIIDEIDSILIDEARTPLIISGRANQSSDLYKKADNFVKNKEAAAPLLKPFTPDHIVYCGPYPLFIENIDQAKEALDAFMTENDKEPRLILVQGVGAFIMEDDKGKAAKAQLLAKDAIKLAVYAESFGGPLQMTDEITYFITHWEAEAYRSKK